MSTVHLAFSPDPAYVRTVRLVAGAVARRAGVPDEVLDELKLAIGEACTRAVALHRRHGLPDLIDVAMTEGARFTVRVIDRSPTEPPPESGPAAIPAAEVPGSQAEQFGGQLDPLTREAGSPGRLPMDEDALTEGVGIALLTALVSDLTVERAGDGKATEVRMSWPVGRRSAH